MNQIQPATQNKILTQSNPTQKNKLEMLGWIELDQFWRVGGLEARPYLWDNSVIETLLAVMLEPMSCCNDVADKTLFPMKLAGCVGAMRAIELVFVMRTTEAIFGLSATFSWMHSNPMWIHLIISIIALLLNVGSMRFDIVPLRLFFHAYRNISMWTYHVKEEKLHSRNYFFFLIKKKREKKERNLPFYIPTHMFSPLW